MEDSFLTLCCKVLRKDGSVTTLAGMPNSSTNESLASLLSTASDAVLESTSEVEMITFFQGELKSTQDGSDVMTENALGLGFCRTGLVAGDKEEFYKLIDSEHEETLP